MRIRALACTALAATLTGGLFAPSVATAATGPHTVYVVGTYNRVVIDAGPGAASKGSDVKGGLSNIKMRQ